MTSKNKTAKQAHKKHKNTTQAPQLFDPIDIRGLRIRNRVWLPPMCMYAVDAQDGKPTPFHYQHYVSRAMGGFGMIITEATAISAEGRISPNDCGLWNDDQVEAWKWITEGIRQTGAIAAVQLNHAGRKASSGSYRIGFEGETVPADQGGWQPVGPTSEAYEHMAVPHALTTEEIYGIIQQFQDAARRAVNAGFQAIEIHAAHGYLLSQFLDPLVNTRTDEFGGNLDGRMKLTVDVVDAVRAIIPDTMPVLVRISATDWAEGGWDIEQSIELARVLRDHGADLIDVSTGGIVPKVTIPVEPNYQVPFAQQIRQQAGIPVSAVGLITKPRQAQKVLNEGYVDVIEIGRAALRDPYWPMRAAYKLNADNIDIPAAYERGAYRRH